MSIGTTSLMSSTLGAYLATGRNRAPLSVLPAGLDQAKLLNPSILFFFANELFSFNHLPR